MTTNRIIPHKRFFFLVVVFAILIIITSILLLHAEHGHKHSKHDSKENSHDRQKSRQTMQDIPAVYRDGCGGCHMPYPPKLLPSNSWERILGGLSNHFEATVDLTNAEFNEIKSFLVSGAATGKRAKEDALRITDTSWFQHEHRKAKRKTNITNMADCQSCHPKAIEGVFEDD